MAYTIAQILEVLETAIYNRLSGGAVASYSLPGGFNVQSMPLDQLMACRDKLKAEISASATSTETDTFVEFPGFS